MYRLEINRKPFLRYTTENKEKERIKQFFENVQDRDAYINQLFLSHYK